MCEITHFHQAHSVLSEKHEPDRFAMIRKIEYIKLLLTYEMKVRSRIDLSYYAKYADIQRV